jgi:hypothetical protein
MLNIVEANQLAKQYYQGVMEFQFEGQTWIIEGVKKIKDKKKWRKVLVVSCAEERVFLELQ